MARTLEGPHSAPIDQGSFIPSKLGRGVGRCVMTFIKHLTLVSRD